MQHGRDRLVLRDGRPSSCARSRPGAATFSEPIEAITGAKLGRLRRLAGRWLAEHEVSSRGVRIDIVALHRDHEGNYSVHHVVGA